MTASTTRTRSSASLAAAAALAGSVLSGTVAAPIAHADALDPIKSTVASDRLVRGPGCETLNYNGQLEDIAQRYARVHVPFAGGADGNGNTTDAQGVNYNGEIRAFWGHGDPQAAATTRAYEAGAGNLIGNCDYTEFGVGFIRYEEFEVDDVAIVLGKPAPKPAEAPKPDDPDEAPIPEPGTASDEVAPTDAIRLSFDRGFFTWTPNVTSTAPIPGKCTYVATNALDPDLPGVNEAFDIGPKGSTSWSVLAPPSTYHVEVRCSGPFKGQTVEFGRVNVDVP